MGGGLWLLCETSFVLFLGSNDKIVPFPYLMSLFLHYRPFCAPMLRTKMIRLLGEGRAQPQQFTSGALLSSQRISTYACQNEPRL